jgi:hypothetical protein
VENPAKLVECPSCITVVMQPIATTPRIAVHGCGECSAVLAIPVPIKPSPGGQKFSAK